MSMSYNPGPGNDDDYCLESTRTSFLAPSHALLTKDNLENLPDVSRPLATLTATSTAGSTDPCRVSPEAPIDRSSVVAFRPALVVLLPLLVVAPH